VAESHVVIVLVNSIGLACAQEVKVTFLQTESPVTIWETGGTTAVNVGAAVGTTVAVTATVGEAVKVGDGNGVGVGAAVST
jgi:hypothetical protein